MPETHFSCNGREYRAPERQTIAICIDGTAPAYLTSALGGGAMPNLLEALSCGGVQLNASAQIPTLTNVNNASILTGVSAAIHGISGNHYLAPDGVETQLTDPGALRAETVLAAALKAGVAVLAVTAKDKLRALLGAGEVPSISAECAHEQTIPGLNGSAGAEILGKLNPGVYDPGLSSYTIDLALALADRLQSKLVYCSLTDYVQHKAAPGEELAEAFYSALDERLGRALERGWIVGMVADHGMNAKTERDGSPNARYLSDVLDRAGIPSAKVVLPITDPYVVHHGALGSIAFVYVNPSDLAKASEALSGVAGVEAVLHRSAAARLFELPEDRIGELVVCADRHTVLGKAASQHDLSAVKRGLRSHGGLHERDVPLLICHPLEPNAVYPRDLRNADLFDLLLNRVL